MRLADLGCAFCQQARHLLRLLVVLQLASRAWLGNAMSRPEEQLVSVRPLIFVIPDFASPSECQDILDLIESCHRKDTPDCQEVHSRLAKKTLRKEGDQEHSKPLRNSTSFMLTINGEINGTVDALVRRSHLLARHPITYGEGVQIASYHPGDYYGFHHDSLMRRATLLVYLTDVPEGGGGETIFPLVRAPGVPDDAQPPLPAAVTGQYREGLDFKVKHMEEMAAYCASDFYLKIRPERGKAILQRWMRFEENSLVEKGSEAVRHARTEWGLDRLLKPDITPMTEETAEDKVAALRASIESHRHRHSAHIHSAGAPGFLSNESVGHHREHAVGSSGRSGTVVNPWEL